jgi:glycosyltransferase involved in cell wall biosynthesis
MHRSDRSIASLARRFADMKIFIGLQEIAGYYGRLQKGLDELGIPTAFLDILNHRFRYDRPAEPYFIRVLQSSIKPRLDAAASHFVLRQFWFVWYQLALLFTFLWALARFDAFIFSCDSTFFGYRELPILSWLGKKVIYVFHGSDIRPPFIDGAHMARLSPSDAVRIAIRQKRALQRIEKYSKTIVSHSAFALFQTRPFVQYLSIGIPALQNSASPTKHSPCVRILHCPSDPVAKGSEQIRRAIQNLQAKGHAIEWIEVVGRPHAVVLKEIQACDFVVDQLYSDTPMAGFAMEAATCGKPAVVGGYDWDEITRSIPPKLLPPSQRCEPENIEAAIEKLIVDRAFRHELGRQALDFVQTHWKPRDVAGRFLKLLEDTIPADWNGDPQAIRRTSGFGISRERVQSIVREIVAREGPAALQLSDKPELERLFLELSRIK